MARILVTGGAGFIGSALLAELGRAGHDLAVVDDLSFGRRELVDLPDERFHELDVLDREGLAAVFLKERPEWVVHLAAVHFIPYCNEHPVESATINVQGTLNVLDLAQATGVEKLFFASTAAVYPIRDEPLDEETPTGPMDIYGLTKLAGERFCNELHLMSGIPVVVCRFFNAFGPNETNPHLIPEIQRQVNSGLRTIRLGNLTPKRDFIHTHDMARAVRMLLEQHEQGIETYNLGRGIEYSVTEVVEAFERALGEKIQVEQDPSRMRKVERMHLLADVSKLERTTGWKAEWDLDRGVRTLVER